MTLAVLLALLCRDDNRVLSGLFPVDNAQEVVADFLTRLHSGGVLCPKNFYVKTNDLEQLRRRQAKKLWDFGAGVVLGLGPDDFEKYLNGTDSIAPIPSPPEVRPRDIAFRRYPNNRATLILVDKRILRVENTGYKVYSHVLGPASLLGLVNSIEEERWSDRADSGEEGDLYWMWRVNYIMGDTYQFPVMEMLRRWREVNPERVVRVDLVGCDPLEAGMALLQKRSKQTLVLPDLRSDRPADDVAVIMPRGYLQGLDWVGFKKADDRDLTRRRVETWTLLTKLKADAFES